MTVMDESGTPPGVTAIGIEGDSEAGHIRIGIFYGEVKSKIIEIPVRATTEPGELSLQMLEFNDAKLLDFR